MQGSYAHFDDQPGESEWSGGRQAGAIVLAGVIHIVWIAFVAWYLKAPESVLCSDDPGGFIDLFPPCPTPRPGATLVGLGGAALGIAASIFVPAKLTNQSVGEGFIASVMAMVGLTILVVTFLFAALALG